MNDMTRQEHLQWCKDRALEYVDVGDTDQAWASMVSDLGKHEETEDHSAIHLGCGLFMNGMLNSESAMREFIVGFN